MNDLYARYSPGFRWNSWNVNHIAEHGVDPDDAEYIVTHAGRPYPQRTSTTKWLVRGALRSGRCMPVIYIFDPEDVVYVLHGRPLTERERLRYFKGKS